MFFDFTVFVDDVLLKICMFYFPILSLSESLTYGRVIKARTTKKDKREMPYFKKKWYLKLFLAGVRDDIIGAHIIALNFIEKIGIVVFFVLSIWYLCSPGLIVSNIIKVLILTIFIIQLIIGWTYKRRPDVEDYKYGKNRPR